MSVRLPVLLAWAGLLLAQRPAIEDAWDLLGKGARDEAVLLLERIIKKNPGDADARLLLGSVLTEDGKLSEAIPHLQEAVRLRPASAEARNALGDALRAAAQTKAAREEFEEAVKADPKYAPARVSLGLILLEAGEFPAAAQHLERAIDLFEDNEDAAFPHYLRAKIYTEAGDVEKAAVELQKAIALRPDFAEAWSDLGEARKALRDESGALDAHERAVRADPENAVAQYRLGSEYLQQDKTRQAVEHLEAALRLNPDDQSTLYNLQLALRREGQLERAASVKAKLAVLLRERDKAYQNATKALHLNNEGAGLEKAGNLRGALEKYREAVQLDPEHVGIRTNLAAALLRLGKWREGTAELREALRRDPENEPLKKALEDALAHAP